MIKESPGSKFSQSITLNFVLYIMVLCVCGTCVCVSQLHSSAVLKYTDENTLQNKGFILGPNSGLQSIAVGKSQQQALKAASYITAPVKNRENECPHVHVLVFRSTFQLLHNSGLPPQRILPPTVD